MYYQPKKKAARYSRKGQPTQTQNKARQSVLLLQCNKY